MISGVENRTFFSYIFSLPLFPLINFSYSPSLSLCFSIVVVIVQFSIFISDLKMFFNKNKCINIFFIWMINCGSTIDLWVKHQQFSNEIYKWEFGLAYWMEIANTNNHFEYPRPFCNPSAPCYVYAFMLCYFFFPSI